MTDKILRNKIGKFMDDWLWEFIPDKEDNLLNAEGQLWGIIDDVSNSVKEECTEKAGNWLMTNTSLNVEKIVDFQEALRDSKE